MSKRPTCCRHYSVGKSRGPRSDYEYGTTGISTEDPKRVSRPGALEGTSTSGEPIPEILFGRLRTVIVAHASGLADPSAIWDVPMIDKSVDENGIRFRGGEDLIAVVKPRDEEHSRCVSPTLDVDGSLRFPRFSGRFG